MFKVKWVEIPPTVEDYPSKKQKPNPEFILKSNRQAAVQKKVNAALEKGGFSFSHSDNEGFMNYARTSIPTVKKKHRKVCPHCGGKI